MSGLDAGLFAVGVGTLLGGADVLVRGASGLASRLGISPLVIGLTVVAIATSAPELAVSLMATLRGESAIAVGNVVGSNIFNILAVLGAIAAMAPGGVPLPAAALRFDVPVMIAVALACLPIFFTGHVVSRKEGALLLAYYGAYVLYLVLAAGRHALAAPFGRAVVLVAVPITAVAFAVLAAREWRRRQGERPST